MSKYNIEVVRLSRASAGGQSYTGSFLLTDSEAMVSFDNGKTINKASVVLAAEVESIAYSGGQIAKIKGTQGQRREALVNAAIKTGDDYKPVQVIWTAGHRSSVAAAFAALWTELIAQGGDEILSRSNPRATKISGTTGTVNNSAPQVNKIAQLEEMLNKQQEMMAMLMAQLMAPKSPAPIVVEEPTDAELEAEEAQLEEMFAAEVEEEATPVEDELAKLIAEQAMDSKKAVAKKGRR